MEIGKLFKFKDKVVEIAKRSLVFYHIKCKGTESDACAESYIGKTERILHYRLEEHKKQEKSALHEHQMRSGHEIDYDGVVILDKADTDRKLQIKELLYIDKLEPTLNKQVNSQTKFRINVNIVGSKKKTVQFCIILLWLF